MTMINAGLPLGGTCVNVGCVPSKALLRAAEAHHAAGHSRFAGIETSSRVSDFAAVMNQKRALVADLRQAKYADVLLGLPGFRLVEGYGRLLGGGRVEVDGEVICGDRVLIATGSSPAAPSIEGLQETGYLTSESLFELDALPGRLLVLGAGYIGLECAQMAARFGAEVTVVQRGPRVLSRQPAEITAALAEYLRAEGMRIETNTQLRQVRRTSSGIEAVTTRGGVLRADAILLATGVRGNSDRLGLADVGVDTTPDGFVVVDDTLATIAQGVYAAGDVAGAPLYVYTAAYEGKLATANALSGAADQRDCGALPWVVFTDPQVAGVGMDVGQATAAGIAAEVASVPLSHVPRAIAARDTRGLIQLTRAQGTRRLLGARVLAAEGGELVTAIAVAIEAGLTSDSLAQMLLPYLTLSEGLKLAAIAFDKDVSALSCCAA